MVMSGFLLCATNVVFFKSIHVNLHLSFSHIDIHHTEQQSPSAVGNKNSWKVFNHQELSPLGQREAGRTWRLNSSLVSVTVPMLNSDTHAEKKINRKLEDCWTSSLVSHLIKTWNCVKLVLLIHSVSVQASSQPASIWVISVKGGVF